MADGLVERRLVREGRGRPAHHYVLTKAGEKASGTNYSDLVAVLWDELRAIEDPTIRTGLLRRVAKRLAGKTGAVEGASTEAKLESIADKMGDRDVPFEVAKQGELPVLLALACPYPELAEQDRSICSVEKMLFSEMLGERVRLTECRLEGAGCCSFVPTGASLPGND
jgi:predicted ArsR family transcriptional regulator